MTSKEQLPSLKLGTGWVRLLVEAEPEVVLTIKGYAPVIRVRALKTNLEYLLYISARSLAEPLERLRRGNGNKFTGLSFDLRKASLERMALYELRASAD